MSERLAGVNGSDATSTSNPPSASLEMSVGELLEHVENLVSRTVTPYEYALNIARLIRITKQGDDVAARNTSSPVMSQVAERLGVERTTIQRNKTISNLIPQLGQLLNDKIISQFAAYQLGQLPEDDPGQHSSSESNRRTACRD